MSPVVRIVNHRRCFGWLDDLPARRPGDQILFIILLVHLILFYTKTSPTANIGGAQINYFYFAMFYLDSTIHKIGALALLIALLYNASEVECNK